MASERKLNVLLAMFTALSLAVVAVIITVLAGRDDDPATAGAPAGTAANAEPARAEPTEFVPVYADVAEYLNQHLPDGHPMKGIYRDDNPTLDDALGGVCDEVDGRPVRPKYREGFAESVRRSSGRDSVPRVTLAQAGTVFDTIVAGCRALGHSERYVKPVPMIDEGVWTVGLDVPPGSYRSDGDFAFCYWEITRAGSNGRDIIANDNIQGGRPTVTLQRGQIFKSQDCGTWTKVG